MYVGVCEYVFVCVGLGVGGNTAAGCVGAGVEFGKAAPSPRHGQALSG